MNEGIANETRRNEKAMVKLPISDYVATYYKEQGIDFTLRQQAHFCWYYNDLLKDQLSSIKEILAVSDDKKLNTEIRERIEYEEKAYECFMTNNNPGCFYIFCPDDEEEYYKEYFSSAENAVSYGIRHPDKRFKIEKRWLFDKIPKELPEKMEVDALDDINTLLSWYCFTSEGDVIYGGSHEYKAPFDQEDKNRFENMFLNIKSPFGLGDIVMGPDFEHPAVVSTDHDCFLEHYDRVNGHCYVLLDSTDNCIIIDYLGKDGTMDYDHVLPFDMWKVDAWEDKEYWELLQIMSTAARNGICLYNFNFMRRQYGERNEKSEDK